MVPPEITGTGRQGSDSLKLVAIMLAIGGAIFGVLTGRKMMNPPCINSPINSDQSMFCFGSVGLEDTDARLAAGPGYIAGGFAALSALVGLFEYMGRGGKCCRACLLIISLLFGICCTVFTFTNANNISTICQCNSFELCKLIGLFETSENPCTMSNSARTFSFISLGCIFLSGFVWCFTRKNKSSRNFRNLGSNYAYLEDEEYDIETTTRSSIIKNGRNNQLSAHNHVYPARNVVPVKSIGNKKCSLNHGLKRFTTKTTNKCKLCQKLIQKNSVMYGCDVCEYNICWACNFFSGSFPSESKNKGDSKLNDTRESKPQLSLTTEKKHTNPAFLSWFQEKKIYMTNEAIEVLINIGVQEPSDLKDLDDDDIESVSKKLSKIPSKRFKAELADFSK